MSFTLRSTSNSSIDNERLTRARQAAATAAAAETTTTTTTLNRFLSFNENQSSSAENRRRLLHVNIMQRILSRHLNIHKISLFLVYTKFN